MYEGLHDTRKGLSDDDATLIGDMTAELLLHWARWVHRRVERVHFCDEDAVHRDVSIDFTLPHWFHMIRETEAGGKRQLVPLGFLSKGALIKFSLRDEHDSSLPLLTKDQNAQVAAATLTAIAREALDGENDVPDEIQCDIRHLVSQPLEDAQNTLKELFEKPDQAFEARERLRNHKTFVEMAAQFAENFLALSMLNIREYERRIIHLSYETRFLENRLGGLLGQARLAVGAARRVYIAVRSASEAASYHLEVEAPEGHMISGRDSLRYPHPQKRDLVPGGFRRAHFHLSNMSSRRIAPAMVFLHPRRSTIIRFATLSCLLALAATLVVAIRYPLIQSNHGGEVATAILLTATGFVGFFIARNGDDEMANALLYPLRILAIIPVVSAFFAALVIVDSPPVASGQAALFSACFPMALSAAFLIRNWHVVSRAAKR